MEYWKILVSKTKDNTASGKDHLFLKQGRMWRGDIPTSQVFFRSVQPSHASCNAIKINETCYRVTY